MARKPEPSFMLKEIIWDLAATTGAENLSALCRDLDYRLEKLRKNKEEDFSEDMPDIRTVRRIIELDINRLPPEVVVAKLPRHVWHLRNDYEAIKQLAEGLKDQQEAPTEAVIEQEEGQIYREGTATTVAGQGKLFSIELPMRQATIHQLRVRSSVSCVFMVMICERGSTYVDAMESNIGMFESHGRVAMETFRLPDWYYEDKDGGTNLHLEITPLIDQYLKPQTPVEFRVGVWFTSISQ